MQDGHNNYPDFWHSDVDMAYISLMHCHGIELLNGERNIWSSDSWPCYGATCNLFASQHYTCRPTVENVICKDIGINVQSEWMPKSKYPGVTGCRKLKAF